jgi:hypothetical protein
MGGNASLTLNGGSLASNAVVLRAEGNTDFSMAIPPKAMARRNGGYRARQGRHGWHGQGGTVSLLVNGVT